VSLLNISQLNFNKIVGIVNEVIDSEQFPSFTIEVGYNSKRYVNLVAKRAYFDTVKHDIAVGDKVGVTFFLSSRFKYGRWYTLANILNIEKQP
jgi:hypothetical protein